MRINSGAERLIMAAFVFLFVSHICGCLWMMVGEYQLDVTRDMWLSPELQD